MSLAAKKFGVGMAVEAHSLQPESILAVIPCLNEEDHIETCIRSLMSGDEILRALPLVVVDGGSSDRTIAIVESLMEEFDNLRLLHNPKKLQSAALNLAVQDAATKRSEWLVRCDAHSIYPENFILSIVKKLNETNAQSVVIPMDAIGTTCFEKANAWIVDTPLGSGGSAHRGGTASGYVDHGHHAGFSIEDFKRVGGYDETFSHNEDAEFDFRLAQNGGRIYLDADTRIKYIPRGTVSGLAKQYYNYGKGRARNAQKNNTGLKVRQLLPVIVLLANLAGFALSTVFLPALILPLGYAGILSLASAYVMLKHRSLCGVFSGVALGTMHMSWATGFLIQSLRSAGRSVISFYGNTISSIGNIFRNLFRKPGPKTPDHSSSQPKKPTSVNRAGNRVTRVPEGTCIYAIGDIHGRFDLLCDLLEQIREDASTLPDGTERTLVFLGDYIDRGFQSRQIVDLFLSDELSDFKTVYLMGNHEQALLNFIQDPSFGEKWALYGGSETLYSYGVQPPARGLASVGQAVARDQWLSIWNQFRSSISDQHLAFYRDLKFSYTIGDYIFVHAGLRPGVSIDQQLEDDVIWIREEFLLDTEQFDKLVVHGHTPADYIHHDDRRIGLDTGAYMTGRLTAARFEADQVSYLST